MADVRMSIEMGVYRCEPCSRRQGIPVTQLIRMLPKAALVDGQLVSTPSDEWYCCPICFGPKFPVNKKRAKYAGNSTIRAGKPQAGSRRPALRLVKG